MANVTVIPATRTLHSKLPINNRARRRVARYARVSTDSEEQLTSYEAQVDYYTKYIRSNPEFFTLQCLTNLSVASWSVIRFMPAAFWMVFLLMFFPPIPSKNLVLRFWPHRRISEK